MGERVVSELTLARIWQERRYARELRATDGRRVHVVYGGSWTWSNGPDFRDAMVELDGALQRGSIELHLRASDWLRHGHATNPAYDDVVLHVVIDDDLPTPVHGPAGSPIPTVALRVFLSAPLDQLADELALVGIGSPGGGACLPTLAGGREELVRGVLRREGWRRLTEKRLRFAQQLEVLPPGEALYRGLLDGLGLVGNRDGMAEVAERLPLSLLEALAGDDGEAAAALLLGTGGFLPLSPSHLELTGYAVERALRIEACWRELVDELRIPERPVGWQLNRVRPANHPVRRLASLASLVARSRELGLLATLLALPLDGGRAWAAWLGAATPALGRSRSDQIAANVLAPFVAAYADLTGDLALADATGRLWEILPGKADDSIATATLRQIAGERKLPVRLAIEAQGLHQIGRHGCRALRCFECPIALLAAEHERGVTGVMELAG